MRYPPDHRIPRLHRPPARRRPARARPGRPRRRPGRAADARAGPRGRRRARLRPDRGPRRRHRRAPPRASPTTTTGGSPAEVEVVHHLAAIYDLAVPAEIAQRVNVDGTGNVLALLPRRRAPSSATTTSAPPTSRATAPASSTSTSSTSARASRTTTSRPSSRPRSGCGSSIDRIPTTIYRPAIVVGDSRTGETQKFDGPYYALRFIAASAERRMPIANIGRGATPFNVVPVDFIVDAMAELGRRTRPRSARPCTSAIPTRSPRTRCSAC